MYLCNKTPLKDYETLIYAYYYESHLGYFQEIMCSKSSWYPKRHSMYRIYRIWFLVEYAEKPSRKRTVLQDDDFSDLLEKVCYKER